MPVNISTKLPFRRAIPEATPVLSDSLASLLPQHYTFRCPREWGTEGVSLR